MPMKRVVITGMGAVSPLGRGLGALWDGLAAGRSGITSAPHLARIGGLRSRVAGLVPPIDPKQIERRHRRSMSAMSIYAAMAALEALDQARIPPGDRGDGRLGICLGSTVGSTLASENFFRDFFTDESLERMRSTLFFQIMNHSCAVNVAHALGITGRIVAPGAACSTGCQAVGLGYEMIAAGAQERMLCGGADEFHPLTSATFDIMNAASFGYNDAPARTPRPFDRDRDGVVCAEGAGLLLLESLEAALGRGVPIMAEIIGFATASDPTSIANPSAEFMERCMRLALDAAAIDPADVDYINAHATATVQGDIAECSAINAVFGERVPVSSLKGHLGHTMAASGAIELAASVVMISRGKLIPTLNLEHIDPRCGTIRHVRSVEAKRIKAVLKNNFALGGVNSTIVIKAHEDD